MQKIKEVITSLEEIGMEHQGAELVFRREPGGGFPVNPFHGLCEVMRGLGLSLEVTLYPTASSYPTHEGGLGRSVCGVQFVRKKIKRAKD